LASGVGPSAAKTGQSSDIENPTETGFLEKQDQPERVFAGTHEYLQYSCMDVRFFLRISPYLFSNASWASIIMTIFHQTARRTKFGI
jgi:hypothetical protein